MGTTLHMITAFHPQSNGQIEVANHVDVPAPLHWRLTPPMARGVRQVLTQWKGEPASSATWKDVDSFTDRHPTFHLELLVDGGECHVGLALHTPRLPRGRAQGGSRRHRGRAVGARDCCTRSKSVSRLYEGLNFSDCLPNQLERTLFICCNQGYSV